MGILDDQRPVPVVDLTDKDQAAFVCNWLEEWQQHMQEAEDTGYGKIDSVVHDIKEVFE
jgi:hypothetical protein